MLYLRHTANKLQSQDIGRSSKGHSSEPGCFTQIIWVWQPVCIFYTILDKEIHKGCYRFRMLFYNWFGLSNCSKPASWNLASNPEWGQPSWPVSSPKTALCVVPGASISLLPGWAPPGQHHTEPSRFRKTTEGRSGKGSPTASHKASPSCPAPNQATNAHFFETASSQPAPSASHVPLQSRGFQDGSPSRGQAKPFALAIPPHQASPGSKQEDSLESPVSGLFLFWPYLLSEIFPFSADKA